MVAQVAQKPDPGGKPTLDSGSDDAHDVLDTDTGGDDVVGARHCVDSENVVEHDRGLVKTVPVKLVAQPGEAVDEPGPAGKWTDSAWNAALRGRDLCRKRESRPR